jgi:hypothetical protein
MAAFDELTKGQPQEHLGFASLYLACKQMDDDSLLSIAI